MVLLLCGALFLGGCRKVGYLSSAVFSPPRRNDVELLGLERDVYTFKRGRETPSTLLFFIGGSGCPSLRYYLKRYLKEVATGTQVVALQKRHVHPMTTGRRCSREFLEHDVYSNWVEEQTALVEVTLERLEERPHHVVMMGVSEGADVALNVASRVDTVTHLVLIGSGGMKGIDQLRLLHPGIDWEKLEGALAEDPHSIDKTFLGRPFRYWSSVFPQDPLPEFLSLDIPILVGIGEDDHSVPVESARYLERAFVEARKQNLTLVVYENASHTLETPDGVQHRPDFLRRMNSWIERTGTPRSKSPKTSDHPNHR